MIKNRVFTIALLITAIPIFGVKNFVLISVPGSGKGTFSQYLIQRYGYIQVCPGDIFRSEIMAQTELGKKIEPIVEKGEYVDEDIVCQLIADNLSKIIEQNKPFIIDGFPRSEVSFQFLYKFFKDNNLMNNVCFLQFMVSDDECVNRILGRQVCMQCFKVYNSSSARPKKQNKCDDCGIELIVRKADTKDMAKNRLRYFHENVEPLMQSAVGLYETKKIITERPLQELYMEYDDLFKANV